MDLAQNVQRQLGMMLLDFRRNLFSLNEIRWFMPRGEKCGIELLVLKVRIMLLIGPEI
jgi:hypothetical protein